MLFRANEAASSGLQNAIDYLTPRGAESADRLRIERCVAALVDAHGPVVESYPSWHPLLAAQDTYDSHPVVRPGPDCGYKGLDHTVLFAHAFVTCPYHRGDEKIEKIEESVRRLPRNVDADIEATVLDEWLYNASTTAVLVTCTWAIPPGSAGSLHNDHTISKALAVPMLLEHMLPWRRQAQVGETWETMRPYILGNPHGALSSLFISQETGTAMRMISFCLR